MPLLHRLHLPSSSSSSQQPLPHPPKSISSLSIHKPQAQALKVGSGICTTMLEALGQISLTSLHMPPPSWCWELETRAEDSGHLPQLPTFRAGPPFPLTHNQTLSPYLCLMGSFPALFSSSSNLLRASSSWVRGLGAGLGGMVGSWMKG